MRLKKILRRIAKENGTTPQAVEREIRIAIRAAMQSPDPRTQNFWKELSPTGEEPSIETFFAAMIQKMQPK